jgi:hypothetical protein
METINKMDGNIMHMTNEIRLTSKSLEELINSNQDSCLEESHRLSNNLMQDGKKLDELFMWKNTEVKSKFNYFDK